MFKNQVGKDMEGYVDDLLVKSGTPKQHLDDLREAFAILRQYQMKLNPTKCVFGVGSRKYLGFMVSECGIEANPEMVEAILNMASPPKHKRGAKTGQESGCSQQVLVKIH